MSDAGVRRDRKPRLTNREKRGNSRFLAAKIAARRPYRQTFASNTASLKRAYRYTPAEQITSILERVPEPPEMPNRRDRVAVLVAALGAAGLTMGLRERARLQATMLDTGIEAYEKSLMIQAYVLLGKDYAALLNDEQVLNTLDDWGDARAEQIIETYNNDMSSAILAEQERRGGALSKTALLAFLAAWWVNHNRWKAEQVANTSIETVIQMAVSRLIRANNLTEGYAFLYPYRAKCPICQGWIARGRVSINIALANESPFHPNCPHRWMIRPVLPNGFTFDWYGG